MARWKSHPRHEIYFFKTNLKFLSVTTARSCTSNVDKDTLQPNELVSTPDKKFMQDVAFDEYGNYYLRHFLKKKKLHNYTILKIISTVKQGHFFMPL